MSTTLSPTWKVMESARAGAGLAVLAQATSDCPEPFLTWREDAGGRHDIHLFSQENAAQRDYFLRLRSEQ